MTKKAKTRTFEDFCKENPNVPNLVATNKIDFLLSDVNQDDLAVLKGYFSGICTDWTIYMQLFYKQDDIEQLEKFNGFIFGYIEKAYLERICLKISTLMDPVGKRGNKNLSLQLFIKQTKSQKLEDQFDRLKEFYTSSGIKKWRDKVLAHADLKTLAGMREIKINFERKDVNSFLANIQEFIDMLSDPGVATDHTVVLPRDKDGKAFIQKISEYNEYSANI